MIMVGGLIFVGLGTWWLVTMPTHGGATVATQNFVFAVAIITLGLMLFVAGGLESDCKRRHKGPRV